VRGGDKEQGLTCRVGYGYRHSFVVLYLNEGVEGRIIFEFMNSSEGESKRGRVFLLLIRGREGTPNWLVLKVRNIREGRDTSNDLEVERFVELKSDNHGAHESEFLLSTFIVRKTGRITGAADQA